jgi:ubiquinone/menaquinone biosynthesis C-methylase UbiE
MSHTIHEGAGPEQRVDPSEYTEQYYLNDCEGYSLFRETGGHRLTPRLATVFEMADVRPGQRVLDVACGRGEIVLQAALRGAIAFGIDYSSAAAKLTEETIRTLDGRNGARAAVARMDATRLAFPSETFDTITMADFVEHLYPDELERSFREAYRVLKPSGRLIIHTAPNRLFARVAWPRYVRHVHRGVLRLARRVNYQDKLINPLMLPRNEEFPLEGDYEHVHVNEQTPDGLASLVRKVGFQSVNMSVKDPPAPPFYTERRYQIESRALDVVRFLWPLSKLWPLNRYFSLHIWVTARRPG